jgi:exonuclease III
MKRVKSLEIVRETRTWERPSDHVPVVLDLK